MPSVHCVFQKVMTLQKEEIKDESKVESFDLLISIHLHEKDAHEKVDKLNAEKKHFYFSQIWNVQ